MNIKKTLLTILTLILTVTLGVQVSNAIGSLTPSGTAGDDTQVSLNDIYNKLVDFTASPSATSSPFTTPGSVSASFRTLSEIYNLLTAESADLVAGNIKDGVTVFGVEGTLEVGVLYPTEWSIESTHPDGYVNWFTAEGYCETLPENGGGWRLPTYIELVNAYLTGISGFEQDNYWSSTENPDNPNNAYYVGMGYGDASDPDKSNPYYLVRCVR